MGTERRGRGSFFMQIASVNATRKITRSILVFDVFISRERKCRFGVHPMTFAHNHSRAFQYCFFILTGTFIRWNMWEVRRERSRISSVGSFVSVSSAFDYIFEFSYRIHEDKCKRMDKIDYIFRHYVTSLNEPVPINKLKNVISIPIYFISF